MKLLKDNSCWARPKGIKERILVWILLVPVFFPRILPALSVSLKKETLGIQNCTPRLLKSKNYWRLELTWKWEDFKKLLNCKLTQFWSKTKALLYLHCSACHIYVLLKRHKIIAMQQEMWYEMLKCYIYISGEVVDTSSYMQSCSVSEFWTETGSQIEKQSH